VEVGGAIPAEVVGAGCFRAGGCLRTVTALPLVGVPGDSAAFSPYY
jgi:hypothetical protein